MLGFFLRHYEPLVSRFVVYDNGSTDRSLELLAARGDVEVRPFPRDRPESFVLSAKALQDECWKESRGVADWVIVTAVDEHLYHPRLPSYLASCRQRGVTCIPALGYQMVTSAFPSPGEHLATSRTSGMPDVLMSKLRVFDPDAIEEVDFAVGGHSAAPRGRLRFPWRDELLLLHYKYLGLDFVRARSARLLEELDDHDRIRSWGDYMPDLVDANWAEYSGGLVDLSDRRYVPWLDHEADRWWRTSRTAESAVRATLRRVRATVTRVPSAARGRVELEG